MFNTLPVDVSSAMGWTWAQYEPYVEHLKNWKLKESTAETWLASREALFNHLAEVRARLYVATTVDTTDEEAEARYRSFLTDIVPQWRQAAFEIDQKLIESEVMLDGMAVPLRWLRARVELYREENLPLYTRVSELSTEYNKITGSQTVEWDGETRTLTQLRPIYHETDRSRREEAWRLSAERQMQDREALDTIWEELMRTRGQIFRNANCTDFREYVWKERGRFDYSPAEALQFVDAIEEVVVPAAKRLREQRREQMGLETLRPWDLDVDPQGREPLQPFETVNTLEARAEAIFNTINPELGHLFRTLRSENLLDLENRPGKRPGGYCTYFPVVQRPFIFGNVVGIDRDVRQLLHEAGHAFHAFLSREQPYEFQRSAPMEFNEVASMAMELLALPYISRYHGGFYEEADADRARADQLRRIILFWPYMAMVVAFQHWIYTHHDTAAHAQNCDEKWLELWERFMPGVDYSGLEQYIPNRWRRQSHIFRSPFYYIEYGLARMGAVQIYANALQDEDWALMRYRKALALGGTQSLPELYEAAGARLVFDAGSMSKITALLEQTLESLESPA